MTATPASRRYNHFKDASLKHTEKKIHWLEFCLLFMWLVPKQCSRELYYTYGLFQNFCNFGHLLNFTSKQALINEGKQND